MTRILQLRRGNIAQNDKFTGMPGEITMDVDTKTLRVHDGKMLGGYEIARADLSNVPQLKSCTDYQAFDINTVDTGFWKDLFKQYDIRQSIYLKDSDFPLHYLTKSTRLLGGFYGKYNPDMTRVKMDMFITCTTADAGYNVGDIVREFGLGDGEFPQPVIYYDPNDILNYNITLHTIQYVPLADIWVIHKSTGVKTTVKKNNWILNNTVRFPM